MSSKTHRHGKKSSNNLAVTSRCVGIVFKPADTDDKGIDSQASGNEETHVELHEDGDAFDAEESTSPPACKKGSGFDPRRVFEDFKFRNKTCYWNPALVDSVKSLEYVGFLDPFTVLVRGGDIHLENIRTAWGRRVLKDPAEFIIQRIGDISGIEMQVIPQTQFIPLPESLCLIIMDLNNNQIVATLDTICDKLQHCYQGLHLPSNQLVYDTLGQLIRERKVFHTGCGYFVVTPDTFRFNSSDMSPGSMMSPWTHLHPMYIPAAFSQPLKQPTRSISCQVDGEESMLGCHVTHNKMMTEHMGSETPQVDMPSPRLQRSHSVSARQSRARGRREEVNQDGILRRSSSVKGRNEKAKSMSKPVELKLEKQEDKQKEKVSLFTKIFGRSKKKTQPPVQEPMKKPPVEYATFSAQFPPPEWMWYQQQLDKHVRTETWVQQQMVKSGTWHYLQNMSDVGAGGSGGAASAHFSLASVPERTSEPAPSSRQNPHHTFLSNVAGVRKSHRKSHKHKDRSPVVIANHQGGSAHLDVDDKHMYRNSMGQKNIRLSSLPMPNQGGEMLHSNYVSHPMFSSTPRFSGIAQSRLPAGDIRSKNLPEPEVKIVDPKEKYVKASKGGQSQRKPHKSKKKSHHDRHSSYLPENRHVSGMSSHHSHFVGMEDISVEYHGRLPKKNTTLTISHHSGVNCAGLDSGKSHQSKGSGYQRSRSYRHTVIASERSHGSADEPVGDAHIYANVHVTSPANEIKPKIPERTHRKGHHRKSEVITAIGPDSEPVKNPNTDDIDPRNRLCVELTDFDRRSDHNSDQGTVNSLSSHEQSSQDSALDGTQSSEHSLGTVINTRSVVNRHLDRLISETQELTLGDSGFSSPRVSENSNDGAKKGDCNIPKEMTSSGFTCNNLKSEPVLNNSMGKLNESSDDSYGRITSDTLYENVKANHHKEVLNNMKYLHKEITVSSQNLNVQATTSEAFTGPTTDFDPKQSVVKKFNFEGDFHVVGVV